MYSLIVFWYTLIVKALIRLITGKGKHDKYKKMDTTGSDAP